ncbi:DUF5956 family protein [Arthrobacter sp. H14]|uniref:DUF5956 family protein n=1 Tax=Arthrobacter sp. H14 TaxID=1312959 RepID=UPI000684455B|nr:DUF5956 family protein [Arthrobacter sp. H14]
MDYGSVWDEVRAGDCPGEWVIVTDNGWGALVAWSAGQANLCRQPSGPQSGRTKVQELKDGVLREREEPLTGQDREEIEAEIDSYLSDAGVPPMPRGYVWFIRRPDHIPSDEEFWRSINRAVAERTPVTATPADLTPELAGIMADLYAGCAPGK